MIIDRPPKSDETPLQRVLNGHENSISGKWKPDARFYEKVGINQKRFGMLLRGDLPMYGFEAKALADFFNTSAMYLLDIPTAPATPLTQSV